MLEMITLYIPNIVAVELGSISLAIVGSFLASRNEVLQAMLVSQASSLGVSLSLATLILLGVELDIILFAPVIGSISSAVIIYFLAQNAAKKWRSKAASIFLSLFIFCLSLNYIVTAALPALESHFASNFLGDIATTSSLSSWYFSFLAGTSILIFLLIRKRLVFQSFWIAASDTAHNKRLEIIFYVSVATLIIESTRLLGFLLTLSSLVILPLCASIFSTNSVRFFSLLLVLAGVTAFGGFILSLSLERLPTSAVIALTQAIVGGVFVFLKERINRFI